MASCKVPSRNAFRAVAWGDIYQLKVNEDGAIEQDSSRFDLSDRRRDAIAYLSRCRRWFATGFPFRMTVETPDDARLLRMVNMFAED